MQVSISAPVALRVTTRLDLLMSSERTTRLPAGGSAPARLVSAPLPLTMWAASSVESLPSPGSGLVLPGQPELERKQPAPGVDQPPQPEQQQQQLPGQMDIEKKTSPLAPHRSFMAAGRAISPPLTTPEGRMSPPVAAALALAFAAPAPAASSAAPPACWSRRRAAASNGTARVAYFARHRDLTRA
jgi:hypothetical protein